MLFCLLRKLIFTKFIGLTPVFTSRPLPYVFCCYLYWDIFELDLDLYFLFVLCHPLFSWQPRCVWHIECQLKERLRTWASFGLTFWHGLFGCFLLIFARFVYNFYTASFTKDDKKDTKRMSFPKRQVFLCRIWTSFNSKRKKVCF